MENNDNLLHNALKSLEGMERAQPNSRVLAGLQRRLDEQATSVIYLSPVQIRLVAAAIGLLIIANLGVLRMDVQETSTSAAYTALSEAGYEHALVEDFNLYQE